MARPVPHVSRRGDDDFLDQARRAADEIPNAELLVLEDADHYGAHVTQGRGAARCRPAKAVCEQLRPRSCSGR